MKKAIIVVLGISGLAALGFYFQQANNSSAAPGETSAEAQTQAASTAAAGPVTETPAATAAPNPVGIAGTPSEHTSAANQMPRETQRAVEAVYLTRTVDLLVSPLVSVGQKRDAWRQLRQSGKLDPVIAELEQRIAQDPHTAAYPAALGQAYLQKCATIDDMREKGILAMQADKVFETALNLDPGNWEARFTKAVAMSYWPPVLNKGEEVVQQFQTLIQQQEVQPPQPHFADSYAWLGDQYLKTGHADDARAVWQRGAALFPEDGNLQKKLAAAVEPAANPSAAQQ